jgi:hypothetical protein
MFTVCVLSEISIAKCSSIFILFESLTLQNDYSASRVTGHYKTTTVCHVLRDITKRLQCVACYGTSQNDYGVSCATGNHRTTTVSHVLWDTTKRLQWVTCYVDDCQSFMPQFQGGFMVMKYNYEREISGFLSIIYENSDLLGYNIGRLNQLKCRHCSQTFLVCLFIRFARISYGWFIAICYNLICQHMFKNRWW